MSKSKYWGQNWNAVFIQDERMLQQKPTVSENSVDYLKIRGNKSGYGAGHSTKPNPNILISNIMS